MNADEMRSKTLTLLRISADDQHALGVDGLTPHIAAFHGQQAVEKILKAWLFSLGVEAPKTHSFKKLVTLLELKGRSVPEMVVPMGTFSDFAAQWRYEDIPEEGEPDIPAMRLAVAKFRAVLEPVILAELGRSAA